MRRLFGGELPDAMDNTLRVAEMVDLRLEFDQLRLPHFPVPDGETATSLAAQGVRARAAARYGNDPGEPVRQRLSTSWASSSGWATPATS